MHVGVVPQLLRSSAATASIRAWSRFWHIPLRCGIHLPTAHTLLRLKSLCLARQGNDLCSSPSTDRSTHSNACGMRTSL